jgi:SAM-dependent methyltransferase
MTHSAFELNTRYGCTPGAAADASADRQSALNAYFRREAGYWTEIYQREGTKEAIHQERLRAALAMVDTLQLLPEARVLDVGCGAGYASVALARRKLRVDALDPVAAMVEATRDRAIEAGVESRVTARAGDVHALAFADDSFALVLALGVLPWLPDPGQPLREMARIVRPGGHLIVSVDAQWQLRHAFDPLRNPVLTRPKRWLVDLWRSWRRQPPKVRSHVISIRGIRRLLAAQGLQPLHGAALGFGPFTCFDREILPPSMGLRLHHLLQSWANRQVPILRSSGTQYLILAKKPDAAVGAPLA